MFCVICIIDAYLKIFVIISDCSNGTYIIILHWECLLSYLQSFQILEKKTRQTPSVLALYQAPLVANTVEWCDVMAIDRCACEGQSNLVRSRSVNKTYVEVTSLQLAAVTQSFRISFLLLLQLLPKLRCRKMSLQRSKSVPFIAFVFSIPFLVMSPSQRER